MRILVVNPPNAPFSSTGILIEPIDALSLASWIASLGAQVELLDMDVHAIEPADFQSHCKRSSYDMVAIVFDYHIPLHCDGALPAALQIAGLAHAMGSKVVVAGKTATYRPGQLLFAGSPVDALLRHEAELSLKALIELADAPWTDGALSSIPSISYLDREGQVASTAKPSKPFDMSLLPIPDRSLVDLESYIDVRTILSSRGCHMKCGFCHVPGFWGGWRGRPASSVVDEIESLVQGHGAKKILFLDDNAPVGKRRMREICEGVIERGIKVSMGCLASIDCFDRELMELMLSAGFRWLHYGVESGDDRLLRSIHKRADAESIRRVVRDSKAMGFRVRASWIMDLPTTTSEELARTASLVLETQADEIRLHHLAIRLGSEIAQLHAQVPSTQYIHKGAQNQNLCKASSEEVFRMVEGIVDDLSAMGYAVVRHPDEFKDVGYLARRSPAMKIASLCPLRYGLEWKL